MCSLFCRLLMLPQSEVEVHVLCNGPGKLGESRPSLLTSVRHILTHDGTGSRSVLTKSVNSDNSNSLISSELPMLCTFRPRGVPRCDVHPRCTLEATYL